MQSSNIVNRLFVYQNVPAEQQYQHPRSGIVRKEPPWLAGVNMTPELIYEYQIRPKPLHEVIQADINASKNWKQPSMVNDQLGQLYLDLQLRGFDSKLRLDEGLSNSSCASDSSSDGEEAAFHR